MVKKKLPLRTGVGAIVLNSENKILVGKRKDNPVDRWQMPQGGVNKNEDYVSAVKRELYEETSIKNIQILKEFEEWLEYELPKNLLGVIWKGKFRGQKQKWFITKFTGEDNEINVNTLNPEFIEWKWIEMDELPNVIVEFKKDIYKKILLKLKNFLVNFS
jgi:putative (di)nucleoside polyphosphate hydrolase